MAIADRLGEILRDRDHTVSTAESCTGGLLASMITDVPGSSDYFDRSVVTYSNDAKIDVLSVPREALDAHGAVSEPVARAMARSIRDLAETDWSISTTGIAGPGGGTAEKPVGTVYIGVGYAGPWGTESSFVQVNQYEFDGTRTERKTTFATQALEDLCAVIEGM